jgi:ketosteroid isomerase-like protein
MTAEVSEGANIMKKSVSSRWFVVFLLFSALAWWASVSIREAAAMGRGRDAPASDSTDVDAIKQLGQDMGNAMVAGDIDKLNQIYADDWATVASSGKIVTKENLLGDFKSFHDKLEWFENGPIDVQVYGDVAVANGIVKEKRIRDGKDTSGEFVYMDLLQKRAGKWVVVRSAGARVK